MKVNQFRVIIAGSRSYTDYARLKEKCLYYLGKKMSDLSLEVVVISGHAEGADKLGEKFAGEYGLRCEVFPADWKKHGKKAGYLRNLQMAETANAVIAFKSAYAENKGTEIMIDIARKKNIPVRVVEDEEE